MRYYLFLLVSLFSQAGEGIELSLVETWTHDRLFGGYRFSSIIDPQGSVIGMFQKDPPYIMRKDQVAQLRPRGQGPSDLESAFGVCLRGEEVIVAEHNGKIKVFEREGNEYKWKESIYRAPTPNGFFVSDIEWCQDRLFLAGVSMKVGQDGKSQLARVGSFDKKGKPLKEFAIAEVNLKNRMKSFLYMSFYLATTRDRVYFMDETRLTVWEIDARTNKELRKVSLAKPSFYKPMPEDFYDFSQNEGPRSAFEMKLVEWKTGYSRVTNMEILGDQLVVQIRTAKPGMPLFGLLFYDLETMNLQATSFLDDLLLGVHENRLYFFAGGNPGLDDEAENCSIKIFERAETK